MKRVVLILLFLSAAGLARADWTDVKEGADVRAVLAAVGTPLMVSRSKSGAQVTWTYDNGAYVLFENGRVTYWRAPSPKRRSRANSDGNA
jgi:hypothetical protein